MAYTNRSAIGLPALSYLIYPTTILLTVSTYAVWSAAATNPAISAFGSVILGLSLIALFEYRIPYQSSWHPKKIHVTHDLIYISMIQVLLPRLLGFIAAIMLAGQIGESAPLASLWPSTWPVAAQVLLLVVLADFMRYWLHRMSHTFSPLWRLHAVHHSVDRLYWLNTSRFHPIEKTLQFFLDTLPFILLGVDIRIIGFWFVIYSVNGFFQHSNIQLQFGWLSSIFSTAEMHRWHHSRKPQESNANYANVFILWDKLFGTYFRPRDRVVGELGLLNRDYPTQFIAQMKAPFIANLDQRPVPVSRLRDVLLNLILKSRMLRTRFTHWRRLVQAAQRPQKTQLAILNKILESNAHTEYGKKYGFHNLGSYEAFSSSVPIVDYEDLRSYIEKQRDSSLPALTASSPVIYNTTSGTTGQPKFIPVVRQEIQAQRKHGLLMTYCQYAFDSRAFEGRIWAIASPAIEGRFDNGTPWGSASGLLYANMSWRVANKYAMPPEVFEIEDHDLKYHTILRLALAEKHITYLTCANPSTILKLAGLLASRWSFIASDIERGTYERIHELPASIASAIRKHLHADPQRAQELKTLYQSNQKPGLNDLWPHLRLVSTWTFGNCAVPLARVSELLSPSTNIVELGYLSSEFRGSLTVDLASGAGLPAIQDYFMEFIEVEKWESGERNCLMLHELKTGQDYYVIVTSSSGLYRYFINDIVRTMGKFQQTPTLRFLQKGKGVTNITGEKLYEEHALQAMRIASARFSFSASFFLICANLNDQRYQLFLEVEQTLLDEYALADFLDQTLATLNIEYAAKLQSGRLKPLELKFLKPGSGEAYRSFCVSAGQKDAQFKTISLQYLHECHFCFDPYVINDEN